MDNYFFQEGIHLSDTMYSISKIQQYYDDLSNYLSNSNFAMFDSIQDFYYDSLNGLKNSYNNGKPTRLYYNMIEDNYYVQGWKDCEPTLSEILTLSFRDTLIKPEYSYWYVLSDSASEEKPSILVNIIDKSTRTPIIDGKGKFGYSASRQKYLNLMRY
jgi:hypothetical protein